MNYPQGSEWRKWDLHVHTPASIHHQYPGDENAAWEAFLRDLESLPDAFKVLGINDYVFLDGYKRILAEREKGRLKNIDLILPVIELRLDKFAGHDSQFQRVNFHVIFDNAIQPDVIETQFINALPRDFRLLPANNALEGRWSAVPTPQSLTDLGRLIIEAAPLERRAQYGSPLREGFNNFNVSLDTVQEVLDSTYFKGRHLTAVGKTEWDAIKWGDASIAEKRNVIHSADIVFTASETIAAFQKARKALVSANVNARLLDCSDGHHLSSATVKDRIGNCFTWIKADTTFAGLQHAINEYDKRVLIADTPDKLTRVAANPTKYVTSLSIRKLPGSPLTERWFDCAIPLNKDMVAIIGNKGSGKSALADTLGLLGDTKQSGHFSFLNEHKFRDPRDQKAAHFEAVLTWQSGRTTTKRLDADIDDAAVETIKYLPQNYIETLCNEIIVGGDSGFDRELKQIIFRHVGLADRFGRDTLDDVLTYLNSETKSTIRVLADRVHTLNQRIVQQEEQLSGSHRAQLESQLRSKREELAAHNQSQPVPVPEPAQNEELQKAAASIRERIDTAKAAIDHISLQIDGVAKQGVELARRISVLDRAITRTDNLKLQYDEFQRGLSADLRELNLTPAILPEEVATLTIDRVRLSEPRDRFAAEVTAIEAELNPDMPNALASRKLALETEVQTLQDSLDEPNRRFVAYQGALESWTKRQALILGSAEIPDSIVWLEQKLADLLEVPTRLAALREDRLAVAREIYAETTKLAESYRRLYGPVQAFVEQQRIASAKIPLSFQVAIVEEGFATGFLDRINRQVRGSFSGIEESQALLRRKLQATNFDDPDSALGFVAEIDDLLHRDRRPAIGGDASVNVSDQLRKDQTVVGLYDFLYSLPFLTPRYTLQYLGHEIHQLSPGERGLLLLVFYLLIDKDDIPLVIDQPEENLDNQTIFEVLVSCLSNAKNRRQLIVVTHNPNLAVVCDAEQIIFADKTAATSAVDYESGAIENPVINKHIIDVLEGTRPAFDNRDSKYF